MQESFIRENLNKLEELVKKYNGTKVLVEKIKYQEEIQNLLYPYKTVAEKLTKEELERVREVVRKAEEIFEETYGKNSEALASLREMNSSRVQLWSKDGKFEEKEKSYAKDEILQARRKEIRDELKKQLRKENGVYLKRDIFEIMRSVSSIRLYKDEQPDRISTKNMVLSNEEIERLKYLKEVLMKDMKKIANDLYFEKDPIFKKIIEEITKDLEKREIMGLVEYQEEIEKIATNSFKQVSMNQEEIELVKEKLKGITNKEINQRLKNVPENVSRIVEEFKRTMEKENYEELVRHSMVVETLKIETFSRERLTSEELRELKGILKYTFKEKIKEAKEKAKKSTRKNEAKEAKIENFKYHWLKAHQQMNKEEQEEHYKALEKLTKTSIYGIELNEKELELLKGELIEKGNKREVTENRREKIEEYIKRQIEEINKLTEEQKERVYKYLKVPGNAIEGIELSEYEKIEIAEEIKKRMPTRENKKKAYIEKKVKELLSLSEKEREEAVRKLEVEKNSIEGIELSETERKEIIEEIRKRVPQVERKEEKIAKYIKEKIEELMKLPEEEREEAVKQLEVKKDSIKGIELTEEEIEFIKECIQRVIPEKAINLETVKELISIQVAKISKMTPEKILESLEKLKQEEYETSSLKDKLTKSEYELYKEQLLKILSIEKLKIIVQKYMEIKKVDSLPIEELEHYQVNDDELMQLGITKEELVETKSRIETKIQYLIYLHKKKLDKIQTLFAENSKIKFEKYGKYKNGKIAGYQLKRKDGEKAIILKTKSEVIEFIKNNPDYNFEKYVISSLLSDQVLKGEKQVRPRKVINIKKLIPWTKEKEQELRINKIPELIRKQKEKIFNKFKKEPEMQAPVTMVVPPINTRIVTENDKKLAHLLGKKLDGTALNVNDVVLAEITFGDEKATTEEEALELFQSQEATALKFVYRDSKNQLQVLNVDDISTVKDLEEITEEKLSKNTIDLCHKWMKLLDKTLKDAKHEIVTLKGILFENNETYNEVEEIENALNQNIKPINVVAEVQATELSEKTQIKYPLNAIDLVAKRTPVKKPEQSQENKDIENYKKVASLFDQKLNLTSLGETYGFLKSISFPDFEYALDEAEANQLIKENQIPTEFTLYCPNSSKELTISVQDINKIIALPVMDSKLSQDDISKYQIIEKYFDAPEDKELGVSYIKMENGEVVKTKSEYQKYLAKSILPSKIGLNNSEELSIIDFLTKMKKSVPNKTIPLSEDNPKAEPVLTGNDKATPTTDIYSIITPETWNNLTSEEQKMILEDLGLPGENRSR